MKQVLAGDIGGTKTLLQLVELDLGTQHYQLIDQQRYSSSAFPDLNAIIKDFLIQASDKIDNLNTLNACFAIAGPIQTINDCSQSASVTNLNWTMKSDDLCQQHGFAHVRLINDFEAIAHGLTTLNDDDLVKLQQGQPKQGAPKIILGAGTGLGVCQIIYQHNSYSVISSEGGHCDFAPNDEQQIRLLQFLLKKYPHLSYDRLLSGLGIHNIFSFLVNEHEQIDKTFVNEVNNAEDPAEKISSSSLKQPIAKETLDIFMKIYGAQAGNLALTNLPYGGVYIAGGIAPKLLEQLKTSDFLSAFRSKGRMSQLMEGFPIHVIMNTDIGVRGAAVVASNINISH